MLSTSKRLIAHLTFRYSATRVRMLIPFFKQLVECRCFLIGPAAEAGGPERVGQNRIERFIKLLDLGSDLRRVLKLLPPLRISFDLLLLDRCLDPGRDSSIAIVASIGLQIDYTTANEDAR